MLSVSVIIPTYNRAHLLSQALYSVNAQTLKPTEIVIVDDGSTDQTAEIVANYGAPIQYVKQDHAGVSAARNHGIEAAQGDIIAWLDADDMWEPNYLSTVVSLLASYSQIAGVYTGFSHIDIAGNPLPQTSERTVPPAELYAALLDGDLVLATPAIALRRSCFAIVGLFDTQLGMGEDYDMWLRLAKRFTFIGVPQPLVKIRVHDSNTHRNTEAFVQYLLTVAQRQFGALEGAPASWPLEKRRLYAHIFRASAIRYIQDGQPEKGWQYIEQAIQTWPAVLKKLSLFYELVCGDEARGQRGDARLIDIDGNGAAMLDHLGVIFARAITPVQSYRRTAYANAYLALGMLSDQAGHWASARHYLWRSLASEPQRVFSGPFVRRLLKLCAGQRLIRFMRQVHGQA